MENCQNLLECFLCQKNLKSKKEYKTHLKVDHSVSNPKDMMTMLQMAKDETTKEILEEPNTNKMNHENVKAVRIDVKNIHMKCDNFDFDGDEFIGVSWFNRVRYECLKCRKMICGRLNLLNHLKKQHNIWRKRNIQQSFCLLGKDEYQCKICSLSLKMRYSAIKYHLISIHGIELFEYEAKYEPGRRFDQRIGKIKIKKEKEINFTGVRWYDRVKYKCGNCDKTFEGYQRIRYHTKRIHGKSHINDFTVLTHNKYSCKICAKEMKLNRGSICTHLKRAHDLTISAYEEKYENNDKENFRENKKKKIRIKSRKIVHNIQSEVENYKLIPWHSRVTLSCNICRKELLGYIAIRAIMTPV